MPPTLNALTMSMMSLYFPGKLMFQTSSIHLTSNVICLWLSWVLSWQNLVARTMRIHGRLCEITTREWNFSRYSSFLHNTDTKMCLLGCESNNVGVDFSEQVNKLWILLGWSLEGKVSQVTRNLHFFYSTNPSRLNLSPTLPDPLPPLIEFIVIKFIVTPLIKLTMK